MNENKCDSKRAELIFKMQELIKQGLDCRDCSAPCCTFKHNSMRITSDEAASIIQFLKSSEQNLDNIKMKLTQCINDFRLDRPIYTKNNQSLRRYYTCPFFNGNEHGCMIPAEYKPLGCLAFNPIDIHGKGKTCKHYPLFDNESTEKLDIPSAVLKFL